MAAIACRRAMRDKAARLFAQAVDIDPSNYEAYVFLATAYRKSGKPEEATKVERRAVTVAEKHLEMYPDDARALYLGAAALVTTGDTARGREWAERALEADPDEPSVLYNVGCMYSLMGDKDRAIALVDEAVRKGFGYRAWLEQDGDLDPLRDDPRFQAILARSGLTGTPP